MRPDLLVAYSAPDRLCQSLLAHAALWQRGRAHTQRAQAVPPEQLVAEEGHHHRRHARPQPSSRFRRGRCARTDLPHTRRAGRNHHVGQEGERRGRLRAVILRRQQLHDELSGNDYFTAPPQNIIMRLEPSSRHREADLIGSVVLSANPFLAMLITNLLTPRSVCLRPASPLFPGVNDHQASPTESILIAGDKRTVTV